LSTPLFDLLESRTWFGEGTVIIITTRDEDLLKIYQVDSAFRIKLMSANESLELFSWHAFREAKPNKKYNSLAKIVVDHCGGLPLALEVIGTCLFEKSKEQWISIFSDLKEFFLPDDAQQIFRISFHRLGNQMEKDLFLDVCCFFVGKGRAYVTKILNGCRVDADRISVLIERSLIKVKKNNKLGMHPLLQQMGREIIREISETERQLWFVDAKYVLKDNTVRKHFI